MEKPEFESLMEENDVVSPDLPEATQKKIEEYNQQCNQDEPDEEKLAQLEDDIFNEVMDFIEGDEEEEEIEEKKPEDNEPETEGNKENNDTMNNTEPEPKVTTEPKKVEPEPVKKVEPTPATTDTTDTSKFPTAVKQEPSKDNQSGKKSLLSKIIFGRG